MADSGERQPVGCVQVPSGAESPGSLMMVSVQSAGPCLKYCLTLENRSENRAEPEARITTAQVIAQDDPSVNLLAVKNS